MQRVLLWVVLAAVCLAGGVVGRTAVWAAPAPSVALVDAALDGSSDRIVPVIVTLRTPDFGALDATDTASMQSRSIRIGSIQGAVAARAAGMLTLTKQQPRYAPLLFARIRGTDIAKLARDPEVAAIAPDRLMKPALSESVGIIGADVASGTGIDGTGTSVAVLDTGVLSTHEFLAGQVADEACFSTTDSGSKSTSLCAGGVESATGAGAATPCVDLCDHGTHVAGIIAGNVLTRGGVTLRGVAPGAKIIAVQVFSSFAASECDGVSRCVMSFTSDQISALEWLYTNRITPSWGTLASVNMSLGGGEFATMAACASDPEKTPIDALRSVGVATVIASGNESLLTAIGGPACISSAIAVGATTSAKTGTLDAPAAFSNRPRASANLPNAQGDRLLDLMAPGNRITSAIAVSTVSYDDWPGTSMATPHVAGAWALAKQVVPAASVGTVLQLLRSTGKTITDTRNGDALSIPRIDVGAAVRKARAELTATATATGTKTRTPTKSKSPTRTRTRNPKHSATKTKSRTKTATRTPSMTRTATATALPSWATSITNGDFEAGLTGWSESSSLGYTIIATNSTVAQYPRSGRYFAWMGGADDETSVIQSSITIPAEASYLRLYTASQSEATVCGAGGDSAVIRINGVDVETIPLCFATNTPFGYVPLSYDVSALRGQTVTLRITVTTNSALISHFLVDDVGYVSTPSQSIYRFPYGVTMLPTVVVAKIP